MLASWSSVLTPYELVNQTYLPPLKSGPNDFVTHPLQIVAINDLAPRESQGEWMDMGTGKTYVATWCALYRLIIAGEPVIVIMPPILIRQWARWLASIRTNKPITVCEYKAVKKGDLSPSALRAQLNLNVDFILVGFQIFKKEYSRFVEHFRGRRFTFIVDEASALGNVDSDIHDKAYEIAVGRTSILLSGTPSDPPLRAYGLLKFTAPGSYRNLKHFMSEHIEEVDFFDRPSKYCNLDTLNANLAKNSQRILFTDMYSATDEPLVTLREYDLDEKHLKLYRKIADEQLLLMPDGGKLDLTQATRLLHALGQLIVNYGHFSGDEKHKASTLNLIDERLEGLGSEGKLLVFAHYKMSIAYLTRQYAKFGAVAINSDVTAAKKEKNKLAFLEDPKCRIIFVQYQSAALGLDGLQWVSNHMLLLEPPQAPYLIRQAIGRLFRGGQRFRVMVDVAVAERTLQVRAFKNLLNNDEVVNATIRNKQDLRRMVYGD